MAKKSFETVLREQCETNPGPNSRRILRVLDGSFLPGRRARLLRRMEAHAREHLATMGVKVGDDWGKVKERDWQSFFKALAEFLVAIMPLILQFL